jgi:DNA-binding response OmpR family regulator
MPVRVVAMDDEADILRMVRIKLEKAGFLVSTAADGREGVERVLAERPDVMIVDIMMPEKDGYQVIREVKDALGDETPVAIMLTSRSETADLVRSITEGADDYVTKPFSPRELIERITVALARKGRVQGEKVVGGTVAGEPEGQE